MSSGFFGSLKHVPLSLVGGGAPGSVGDGQPVPLVPGVRYELRCSDTVYVKPGGGANPRVSDIQVVPDAPLTFTADENSLTIAAGEHSCYAWLREWLPDGAKR